MAPNEAPSLTQFSATRLQLHTSRAQKLVKVCPAPPILVQQEQGEGGGDRGPSNTSGTVDDGTGELDTNSLDSVGI